MPKVKITNTAGLVQEKGSGGLKVVHTGISGSAGVEGIRLAAGGASGFLHIVQGTATVINSTTSTDVTALIPAGSQVLCGKLQVTTATDTAQDFTSVGTASDTDCFSGTIALDMDAVGSQVIAPIALMASGDDPSDGTVDLRLTHGNSGTQTPACQVKITLLVATAATSEG